MEPWFSFYFYLPQLDLTEPACTKLQDESGCITVTNARAFFAAKQSDGSVPGTVGVRRGKYDRSESGPSDTLRTTAPRNEFELIPVRPRSYSALPGKVLEIICSDGHCC